MEEFAGLRSKRRLQACLTLDYGLLIKAIGDKRIKKYFLPFFEKRARILAKNREAYSINQNIPHRVDMEKALNNISVEDR